MNELSISNLISDTVEEVLDEVKVINPENFKDDSFAQHIWFAATVVDQNAASCEECARVKKELLDLQFKLKDMLRRPKENVDYQIQYNRLLQGFTEHFYQFHNHLEDLLKNRYNCGLYFQSQLLRVQGQKKAKKRLEKFFNKFSFSYLKMVLNLADIRSDREESAYHHFKDQSLRLIYNIFSEKEMKTLEADFIKLVQDAIAVVHQERRHFQETGDASYQIVADLFITNQGKDLLLAEERRRRRRWLWGAGASQNTFDPRMYSLLQLNKIASPLDKHSEECDTCRTLKAEMVNYLEELDRGREKKKSGRVNYEKVAKQYKSLFKRCKQHFKRDHHQSGKGNFDRLRFLCISSRGYWFYSYFRWPSLSLSTLADSFQF